MISELATYKNLSPSCNKPRNHAIDTITIHCMAGHMSTKACCDMFANPANEVSSNYTVDDNGVIGCSVDEKDRSWCSSSPENDHRAVTIEVASDSSEPCNVTPKAYEALIKLVADICKRNNIKELKWRGDKSLVGQVDKQNMTVHRWFSSYKSCPGEYLYSHMGDIANRVNELLGKKSEEAPKKTVKETPKTLYRVQVGAFGVKENAEKLQKELKSKGYDAIVVESGSITVAKKSNVEIAKEVLAGSWGNGEDRRNRLKNAGYDPDAVQAEVNKLL